MQQSQWFVIRTISGQEKKVKQYMESEIRRLRLDHLVEDILIPTEKVFEIRNGKKRTRERSFIPGYIFLKATEEGCVRPEGAGEGSSALTLNPEAIQLIKDVPGVVGFLGSEKGKIPNPLREAEINKILGKVDELQDATEVMENPFAIGENVKVMDGPFNGFTGVIEEVHEDKKKLKIMVKIFGRNTPIELDYLQVERTA